jgi:tetratricopeptide (TPR) repeat protein
MEIAEFKKKQHTINNYIIEGKIAGAIPLLSELVYQSHQGDFISTLENLSETYKNILTYSFSQTRDPKREEVYFNLKRQLLDLSDSVVSSIASESDPWIKSLLIKDARYLRLGEHEKSMLIDELASEREFNTLLEEISPNQELNSEKEIAYFEKLNMVFEVLWLKGKYTEGEKQLAVRLLNAINIPWFEKSIIISAISISLFNQFDLAKVELLFDAYAKGENQVAQRALVGIVFAFLIYNNRLSLYPEILNRLKTIVAPNELAKQTEQILIQLIKSQETEKVTEKIQKEIIPEVMKLKPDIDEKLNLDELLSQDEFEDKNPDWENFFSDSPDVYKKLEEFSMMQMDGSDVFMGAFSMLKRFGFFDQLQNWFLPFYPHHPEIKKAIKGVDENFDWNTFFEGIDKAPVMCNSDKYSFCFNIGFMPDMQKTMMLELFGMELKQMSELADDEGKHDSNAANRIIFTQYIQDLYRFYRLHPRNKHFVDPFNVEINISRADFLAEIFDGANCLRTIGEFYFNKNYFNSALEVFEALPEINHSFELIEKAGFCYQKLEQYSKAIERYLQAEILESNRPWLQKKIGYCYRKLGKYDEAITYYKKVEMQEPDNLEVQVYLGQLYIDKEDYETALSYYFKVEYLKPDSPHVQRPIGWCSFLLKKPEQAIRYFGKLTESGGSRADYLNLAHAYWAKGDLPSAIENYRYALRHSANDPDWFQDAIEKDAMHLLPYGIERLEIALMTDYLLLDI